MVTGHVSFLSILEPQVHLSCLLIEYQKLHHPDVIKLCFYHATNASPKQ
jgi:hypothetical protein